MRNEELEMKKIFLAFVIFFVLCSCSLSAENNEDIYVRKDLLESYMKNIDLKFDQVFIQLNKINDKLEILTDSVANLNVRMTKLETRIDGLEKRVDDLREDTK